MRLSNFRVSAVIAGVSLLIGTALVGTTAPPAMAIRPDCYRSPLPNCGVRMSNREAGLLVTGGISATAAVCGSYAPVCAAFLTGPLGGVLGENIRNEIGRGNCIYIDGTFNRYNRIIKCKNGKQVKRLW